MQVTGRQPCAGQRAPDGARVQYERHRPEQTTLYRLAQQHAATLFEQAQAEAGADLPQFVKELVTPVLQVVHRVITRHLLGLAALKADQTDSGAVTLIQSLRSAANLNIHLHCLVLDGVYRSGTDGAPEFVEAPAPTDEALQAVLHKIITRLMKLLTRRGVLVEEQGQTYMTDIDGFSLHAGVRCGAEPGREAAPAGCRAPGEERELCERAACKAGDRPGLEQLCRYITRPAPANERVQTNAAGQVVLKLKTPWRDGTTHIVMSPLEFMQRLAALVPRPRLHLIRFHGVLAGQPPSIEQPGNIDCGDRLRPELWGGAKVTQRSGFTRREPA